MLVQTLAAPRVLPRLVTFDATGTLMRTKRPVGVVYRDAILSAVSARQITRGAPLTSAELAALTVEPDEIGRAFGSAFKAQCQVHPCFGSGAMPSREWWRPVVRNTFVDAGILQDVVDAELDLLFPPLYDSFGTSAAWELIEGSAGVVQQLSRWRAERPADVPLAIGVISNFDDRLPALLESLGIASLFDFVLTSYEHGSEKPCASIFELAQERAGLSASDLQPGTCVHVGDTFKTDIIGAAGKGWRAVYIASDDALTALDPKMFTVMAGVEHERVEALGYVPRIIGAPAATALPKDDEEPAAAMEEGREPDEDDPHVDEFDVDGERAWFSGKLDKLPGQK
jgi:putative hydrolase of the HAD superfamily